MSIRILLAYCVAIVLSLSLAAQETRSALSGRVLDPHGAAIVGAAVLVRNTDRNITTTLKTNETGYFEAALLIPGNYELTAEISGFKKLVRKGVSLPVSSSLVVDLQLEVGGMCQTVSVTAGAPLPESAAVTSGRVLDSTTVMEVPVMGSCGTTL